MLWRIRDYIPHETKILYYNSYVLPLLDYCVNVWGHTSQTHLDCIYRLQKRIVRIISNDHASNINILFHRLNIMTIYERIKFQTIILVYKCLNGMTPDYLQGLIEYAGLNHGYTLRTSGINLNVPKPRTELLRKSFCYTGPNTLFSCSLFSSVLSVSSSLLWN